MRSIAGLLFMATAAAATVGCAQANYTAADRYERGLVVCLSGAGGMTGECDRIREGLNAGGVDRALEVFEWSQGGVLEDQASVELNRRKAAELARRIDTYLSEHRGRPVHLVGLSAGTGLVVWAMEALANDDKITGAILLSSSLDTKYDLTRALERVTDHLYAFTSVADTILSLGVTMAGTVDRGGTLAGGLVGFSPPDTAPEQTRTLYKERLTQIAWWPGDMLLGHMGDHLGPTNPAFVRARIAPLILGKKPETASGRPAGVEAVKADGRRTRTAVAAASRPRSSSAPASEAAGDPKSRTPRRSRGGLEDEGKSRFIDWKVGGSPGRTIDESQFLAVPVRLP
jgi:pimeloyl-ACP methyl ester carboxylesterase